MHDAPRTGFEIELLAPPGSSRQVLAADLALRCGGRVRRTFHTDSEPSTVPGMGAFWHLTPGFEVLDAAGTPVATLVDDITITADLRRDPPGSAQEAPAGSGWYRLLCDEPRLLRLIAAHSDPAAPLGAVLDPVAALFGVQAQHFPAAVRVQDRAGATVALAAPLPAGRERPCEVVTPPLVGDHAGALERLLDPARRLGFTVPLEAAVHLHLDGAPFRRVGAFANVVRLFGRWREPLRAMLGTNPACRRLAPLPAQLLELVEVPWPAAEGRTGWTRLQEAARATGVTKFLDVNLTQLLTDSPVRDTLEVRVLPGSLDGHDVVARARLVDALLARCLEERPLPPPPTDDAAASLRRLHALAQGSA